MSISADLPPKSTSVFSSQFSLPSWRPLSFSLPPSGLAVALSGQSRMKSWRIQLPGCHSLNFLGLRTFLGILCDFAPPFRADLSNVERKWSGLRDLDVSESPPEQHRHTVNS